MKAEKYIALIKKAKTETRAYKLVEAAVYDDEIRIGDMPKLMKERYYRNHELSYQTV